MLHLYDLKKMPIEQKRAYETDFSSLHKIQVSPKYQNCRDYSCRNISFHTSRIPTFESFKGTIVDIPKGIPFHFIGRVDEDYSFPDSPKAYYIPFEKHTFESFSTICAKNISRYNQGIFFIYNFFPEEIVHIFPLDSDTNVYVEKEEELTCLPSLWLTMKELEEISYQLGVYNQITCKTKRNGEIIKPIAVAAFDIVTPEIIEIADKYSISIFLLHPETDAIDYHQDLLYDWDKLCEVSEITEKLFDFPALELYYWD